MAKKINLLITGSSGFIGGSLLKSLLDDDRYVLSISDIKHDNPYNLEFIPTTKLSEVAGKFDVVVHLGATSETNNFDMEAIFRNNVLFSLNLMAGLKKDCKLLYASSGSVYGQIKDTVPVAEERRFEQASSPYALSKLTLDNIVRNFFRNKNYIGLRFFNVCSFDQEALKLQPSPTFKFLKQLRAEKKITLFEGSQSMLRDFIHIDDVMKIMHFLMNESSDGYAILNIGTGKAVSFEQIADAFIQRLGFGSKEYKPMPENLSQTYQRFTCADINALRNLGYKDDIPDIINHIEKLNI